MNKWAQHPKLTSKALCCSLQEMGRICYVSSDSTGVMCLIDAAECPPTFGAGIVQSRISFFFFFGEGDIRNIGSLSSET